MKILVTGICGFVGSTLARGLREAGMTVVGLDNLVRAGSELNRGALRREGINVHHGDLRNPSDLEALPTCDWIIDAAANPSVLAGVDGKSSSRQLLEHNLIGTINLLELAKQWRAGVVLLSTSRVYGIKPLAALEVEAKRDRFAPKAVKLAGFSKHGVAENFSTEPPLSLYGSSKLASEVLALEYGETFGFPVFVNRCGVLAGAGQFGKPDQGIFSYWIHAWHRKRPLKYIGFDGQGRQVRDCLHPLDLLPLIGWQMKRPPAADVPRILNVGGGLSGSASLRELSAWCANRFGEQPVKSEPANRAFDVPWLVLDSRKAEAAWGWTPQRTKEEVWEEIAAHAEANPHWLDHSMDA